MKEQFNALAERIRNAQLTVDQLEELQSIKYFYTNSCEEEGCVKLKAFAIGLLLLLFFVVGLTLSPLSHIAADLLDGCGLQVMRDTCF